MEAYIIQKVKTLLSIIHHPYFGYIKIKTKGYLSPTVYYKIYDYTMRAPAGHVIDIGPAQGGTTIAIAKGLIQKDKNSTWKVYSLEKGHSSNALFDRNNVDGNKTILETNIDQFGVGKVVEVIMKYSDEAFSAETAPEPLAVLSIDADGALDRDFNIFYNKLLSGGWIILDDYENMINRHGEKLLRGTEEEITAHIKNHRAETLADATPLGKEILTFRLVNYMKKAGLIEQKEIHGINTWFGIKPVNAPRLTTEHMSAMQEIRKGIETEFWERRRKIIDTKKV